MDPPPNPKAKYEDPPRRVRPLLLRRPLHRHRLREEGPLDSGGRLIEKMFDPRVNGEQIKLR